MKALMPWMYVAGLAIAIVLSFFELEVLTIFVILAALGLIIGLLSLQSDEVYLLTLIAFMLAFSFLIQPAMNLSGIGWLSTTFSNAAILTAITIVVIAFKFLFTASQEAGMGAALA